MILFPPATASSYGPKCPPNGYHEGHSWVRLPVLQPGTGNRHERNVPSFPVVQIAGPTQHCPCVGPRPHTHSEPQGTGVQTEVSVINLYTLFRFVTVDFDGCFIVNSI